MGQITLYIV